MTLPDHKTLISVLYLEECFGVELETSDTVDEPGTLGVCTLSCVSYCIFCGMSCSAMFQALYIHKTHPVMLSGFVHLLILP